MQPYVMHFPSLYAVTEYIRTTPRTWKQCSSRNNEPSRSWDLKAGYEGALKLASLGWHDGAKVIANGLERLRPHAVAHVRKWSVAGPRLSIGKAIGGNPRCYWKKDSSDGAKPAVRIAVCVTASASVSAEYMANYGMAIASYAEQLQNAGYAVEILCAMPNTMQGKVDACWSWIVKPLHGRMNFSDVAFSIAHPACYRRIGFALFERAPCSECYGYGSVSALKRHHLPDGNWIILDSVGKAISQSTTPERALAYVADIVSSAIAKQEKGEH